MNSTDALIKDLLNRQTVQTRFESMSEWFSCYRKMFSVYDAPFELAACLGRQSHCMGYAFATGYQAAIQVLFGLDQPLLSSLCVTEQTGNHPRAIATSLSKIDGKLEINGHKTFISGAEDAQLMFVACKDMRHGNGLDEDGRPILKVVRVPAKCVGVTIQRMPTLKFVPEVTHGSVQFDSALVNEEDILAGDGYVQYIKAFRTYEDLYVSIAVAAYRLGEGLRGDWPIKWIEAHLALLMSFRQLSEMDLGRPASHLVLSACRRQLDQLISETDSLFEQSDPDNYAAWKRDLPLLSVARNAHIKRTESAWQAFR